MSIEHMRRVFTSGLPPHLRMVLMAIADGANDDGVCWPGQLRLSSKVGAGERAIRKSIGDLVAQGYLAVERRGSQHTNVYTVLIDEAGDPTGTLTGTTVPVTGESDRNHSSGPERNHSSGLDRNHSSGPERNHSSGPYIEPPVEPPVEPSVEPPVLAPAVRERPRNELWDAVAAVFGVPANSRERGRRAKAVALFREAEVGAAEVATLAQVYRWRSRGEWPDTDIAVASRVTDCRRWAAQAEQGAGRSLAAAVDRRIDQEGQRRALERAVEAGPGPSPFDRLAMIRQAP